MTQIQGRAVEMTDEDVARLQSRVPDDPVPMAQGFMACEACGVPVETSVVAERVGFAAMSPEAVDPVVPYARCALCQHRRDQAEEYVREHPRMAAGIGEHIAVERIEGVLHGLAYLGQTVDTDLGLIVPRMHAATHGMRFANPRRWNRGKCNRYAWAHLSMSQRQALRTAYGKVLADSVAVHKPPVPVKCPTIACMYCGITSVTVAAVEVEGHGYEGAERRVWHQVDALEEALGGQISPHRIRGHLCPACTEAVEGTGSIGFTSRTRAVLAIVERRSKQQADHLRLLTGQTEPPSLIAWRALPSPRVPNGKPWAHLRLERL